jgi:hypothetical protein
MHDIDWKWCPRVAAHEITRNFLLSQARLQKAKQTLEAYGAIWMTSLKPSLTCH